MMHALLSVVGLLLTVQSGIAASFDFRTLERDRELCVSRSIATACFNVAEQYRLNEKGRLAEAQMLYDRACRTGFSPACRAHLFVRKSKNIESAAEIDKNLQAECKKAGGLSCHYLALAIGPGPKSSELFKNLCINDRIAASCTELGVRLTDLGETIQAETYLSQGCLWGDAHGCSYGGERAELKKDPKRALDVYSTGCEIYDSFSCTETAKLQQKAGRQADAIKYFVRACEMGAIKDSPCVSASTIWIATGRLKQAEELLSASCKQGDPESCFYMGRVLALQLRDGRSHFEKANELFAAKCQKGETPACARAAVAQKMAKRSMVSFFWEAFKYKIAMTLSRWFHGG